MQGAREKREPAWLIGLDLAAVMIAGGVWYAFPRAGAWPLLIALAPWALRWALTRRLTRRTVFDLPLALFLLTAAIGVWVAFDRQAAGAKFWLVAGGILLYYAFVNAEPIGSARVWLLALFGAGVSAYFLATHDWGEYPAKIEALTRLGRSIQSALPTLPGHRLHPNVAGGVLAMLIPFSCAVLVWQRPHMRDGRRRRAGRTGPVLRLIAALVTLALALFGLLMSTSRGAWVALAAALAVGSIWAVAQRSGSSLPALRGRTVTGLVVLLLLTTLALVLAWPGGLPGLLGSLPGPSTTISRIDLLRSSLTLVRDYPVIGAGLGSFQMLYSTYVLLLHVGFAVHSHNLILNVAIEQGLPAVATLAWMWILFAMAIWRDSVRGPRAPGERRACLASPARPGQEMGDAVQALRLAPEEGLDEGQRGAQCAAALSLIVLLVHGQVDDVLYGSRAVLLLFVPMAFAVPAIRPSVQAVEPDKPRRRELPWRHGLKPLALPLAVMALLAFALIWRRPLLSVVYSNLGSLHEGQAELRVYSWPKWPLQDAVRRAVDLGRPVGEFQQALALNPRNATANRRLGMIELSLGRYADALSNLKAAYSVEPRSATTQQLLGEAYLANGDLAEGRALWSALPNAQGQLAARVFWYGYIGDPERAQWMEQAASRQ